MAAQRKFDWDAARRRVASGETIAEVARSLGVSETSVWRILTPERLAADAARTRAWNRSGVCEECGKEGVTSAAFRALKKDRTHDGRVLCARCRGITRRQRFRFDDSGVLVAVRCQAHDCASGERWQPPDEFFGGVRYRDVRPKGFASTCRSCQNRARRDYRGRHRDAENTRHREYKRKYRHRGAGSGVRIGSTTPKTAELLHWDSEFWGTRIGRTAAPDVDQWAIENTVGLMFLLASTDEPEVIRDAEERGYRYTDVRVELAMKPRTRSAFSPLTIRTIEPSDVEHLALLARRSHRITRFYADPRFDRMRCDDLYEGWLRNSAAGWAQDVLVAGSGRAKGYCTLHMDDGVASIGLIAVEEESRRTGVGGALVEAAIEWAATQSASRISVVTQGRNRAALRTFQRAGFLHARTDVWLHRWMDS